MQSYNLLLNPGQPFTALQARGDLFVYESGNAGSDTAERRIVIKPDADAEIILRPGQRFRLAPGEKASAWAVRLLDPTVTLTGSVIIGAGEFDDANTLNTFKLDGTFVNSVNVNNTAAQRVPVALDPTVALNIAGQTVQYTNAYAENTAPAASQILTVLTPAQNPNGCYIELAEVSGTVGNLTGACALIAKNAVPATDIDGDVIMLTSAAGFSNGSTSLQNGFVNDRLPYRVKIAAGKGLYIVQSANWASCKKTVLTTIL